MEVSLALATNRGRAFRYAATTRADGAGDWSLRVPYSTRGAPPSVRTAASFTRTSGSRRASLAVEEEAVRAGGSVRAPDLSSARPAP